MTTSHHESKREWLGSWWEPVKPTIRAGGRLICGPEYLSLVFPSEWDGEALRTARTEGVDALYGLTDSPDAITILGVTPDPTGHPLAAKSSVFRRVELVRVYGKAALVGIHVPVPTEVSEATVTMDGLAEWCGRPSLYGPDGEVVAGFPNDPKWEQLVAVVPGGQVTLESGYRFTMGTISFTALPYSRLVLSPSDPLDLEVFISQWLAPIQSLFCILLATGSRSSVTVRLTTHTPGSELPLVLPSRMQAEAVVDQAGWYELGAILPYQLVAARFQELVSSWLALYPAKKVAIDRLVSNLVAPFFYDDDRFLTDVAALDGYTAEELQRVPSEIQRAAVAAANAMDPRYSKSPRPPTCQGQAIVGAKAREPDAGAPASHGVPDSIRAAPRAVRPPHTEASQSAGTRR